MLRLLLAYIHPLYQPHPPPPLPPPASLLNPMFTQSMDIRYHQCRNACRLNHLLSCLARLSNLFLDQSPLPPSISIIINNKYNKEITTTDRHHHVTISPLINPLRLLCQIYFRLNEHPSVNRAFPPVGWHSTVEHPPQMTTVCACENTVVMVKQPGHLTSMKKERGAGTRVCVAFSVNTSRFQFGDERSWGGGREVWGLGG